MTNYKTNFLTNQVTRLFKNLFYPYKFNTTLILNEKPILIEWTERANTQLQNQNRLLIIELQLYFACLVTKRITFGYNTNIEQTALNSKFEVTFNAIQSNLCGTAGSNDKPSNTILTTKAAMSMSPSKLQLDFEGNVWNGEFYI